MYEINKLSDLGLFWSIEFRPSLEAREHGDEFDHPAVEYHYRCWIVIDGESEAAGEADTAEEAMRFALEDYESQIN